MLCTQTDFFLGGIPSRITDSITPTDLEYFQDDRILELFLWTQSSAEGFSLGLLHRCNWENYLGFYQGFF